MKKLISVSASFIALATGAPARAADMQVKAPVYKAPPPVYVFSWAGFYIGADVGGGWSKTPIQSVMVIFLGPIWHQVKALVIINTVLSVVAILAIPRLYEYPKNSLSVAQKRILVWA